MYHGVPRTPVSGPGLLGRRLARPTLAGTVAGVSTPSHADETRRILSLAKGDFSRAFDLVERQLSVLVLRTQVMLSLSGIVVTVTGFSGRTIALTSELARASISLGILLVLAAAATAIVGVLRLRWLTQEITDDPHETLGRMLALRDGKSRSLTAALVLFVLGFGCYCVAIAQMLWNAHP